MKRILSILLFTTLLSISLYAGFFNEKGAAQKAEFVENDRLCKIFTRKVEDYKLKLRDDLLAAVSLESYKYRKDLFCKAALAASGKENNSTK